MKLLGRSPLCLVQYPSSFVPLCLWRRISLLLKFLLTVWNIQVMLGGRNAEDYDGVQISVRWDMCVTECIVCLPGPRPLNLSFFLLFLD